MRTANAPPELRLRPAQQDPEGPGTWTSAKAVVVPRAVDTAAKAAAGPPASSPGVRGRTRPVSLVPAAHEAACSPAHSRASARGEVCPQGTGRRGGWSDPLGQAWGSGWVGAGPRDPLPWAPWHAPPTREAWALRASPMCPSPSRVPLLGPVGSGGQMPHGAWFSPRPPRG